MVESLVWREIGGAFDAACKITERRSRLLFYTLNLAVKKLMLGLGVTLNFNFPFCYMFSAAISAVRENWQMEEEKEDIGLSFFRCMDQFRPRWYKLALLIILYSVFKKNNRISSECLLSCKACGSYLQC